MAEVEGDVGGKGKKGGKDAKGKAAEPEETSGDDVAKEQDDLARALSHEEEELTRKLNRLQLVCSDVVERSIQEQSNDTQKSVQIYPLQHHTWSSKLKQSYH